MLKFFDFNQFVAQKSIPTWVTLISFDGWYSISGKMLPVRLHLMQVLSDVTYYRVTTVLNFHLKLRPLLGLYDIQSSYEHELKGFFLLLFHCGSS